MQKTTFSNEIPDYILPNTGCGVRGGGITSVTLAAREDFQFIKPKKKKFKYTRHLKKEIKKLKKLQKAIEKYGLLEALIIKGKRNPDRGNSNI